MLALRHLANFLSRWLLFRCEKSFFQIIIFTHFLDLWFIGIQIWCDRELYNFYKNENIKIYSRV